MQKLCRFCGQSQGFWCVRNVLANQSANLYFKTCIPVAVITLQAWLILYKRTEAFAPKNKEKCNWSAILGLQHLLIKTDDIYCYFNIEKKFTFKIVLTLTERDCVTRWIIFWNVLKIKSVLSLYALIVLQIFSCLVIWRK